MRLEELRTEWIALLNQTEKHNAALLEWLKSGHEIAALHQQLLDQMKEIQDMISERLQEERPGTDPADWWKQGGTES